MVTIERPHQTGGVYAAVRGPGQPLRECPAARPRMTSPLHRVEHDGRSELGADKLFGRAPERELVEVARAPR